MFPSAENASPLGYDYARNSPTAVQRQSRRPRQEGLTVEGVRRTEKSRLILRISFFYESPHFERSFLKGTHFLGNDGIDARTMDSPLCEALGIFGPSEAFVLLQSHATYASCISEIRFILSITSDFQ